MIKTINEVYESTVLFQKWNGEKHSLPGHDGSNASITKLWQGVEKSFPLNNSTVKQLKRFSNKEYHDLLAIGFQVKYKHFTIIYKGKEHENATVTIINPKAKSINTYPFSDKGLDMIAINESDKITYDPISSLFWEVSKF